MPTACSPQDCTSCTSMIGGRPGLYKYLLKIRAVIPLPPVSVRFRFLSSAFLFSSYTVPPLSTKDPVTSLPFPRSTFCAPSCFPPFQLSLHRPFVLLQPLLVTFSLCSLIFPHYNVRARVWEKGTASTLEVASVFLEICRLVRIVHIMGTDGRAERFKFCGGKIIDLS